MTLLSVAKKIIEMTHSQSEIKNGEALLFLSEIGLPDIAKAKESLGWLPLVRLEDGLQKTIDYIRANKVLLVEGGE
jgi:nucleoside-diphosphate-sugar epimerase